MFIMLITINKYNHVIIIRVFGHRKYFGAPLLLILATSLYNQVYKQQYPVVTPAYKRPVFYLHGVSRFVQVLRFLREDDWSALLPSTVDFRGTDQIQAVRQPFVVPLESSL